MMVCAQVMGNHVAITVGGQHGNFELNVMMPVMAHDAPAVVRDPGQRRRRLPHNCVEGISANRERCRELLEKNPSIATALNAYIGYDEASAVAKEAAKNSERARRGDAAGCFPRSSSTRCWTCAR